MTGLVTVFAMEILGEAVDVALKRLSEHGIWDVTVEQTQPPRKIEQAGNLRVVRVRDAGRSLVAARFPDEVERDS